MDLRDKVLFLRNMVEETAAEQFLGEYDPSDSRDVEIAYYQMCLRRANGLLDKRREDLFSTVLDLSTRGQVERARLAYDTHYLYSLGLSLEATSELAQELIQRARQWGLPSTSDWDNVAKFNSGPQVEPMVSTYPRKVLDL